MHEHFNIVGWGFIALLGSMIFAMFYLIIKEVRRIKRERKEETN